MEGKTNFGQLRVGHELVTKKRNQVTLGEEFCGFSAAPEQHNTKPSVTRLRWVATTPDWLIDVSVT
jgi:hypothetical protein